MKRCTAVSKPGQLRQREAHRGRMLEGARMWSGPCSWLLTLDLFISPLISPSLLFSPYPTLLKSTIHLPWNPAEQVSVQGLSGWHLTAGAQEPGLAGPAASHITVLCSVSSCSLLRACLSIFLLLTSSSRLDYPAFKPEAYYKAANWKWGKGLAMSYTDKNENWQSRKHHMLKDSMKMKLPQKSGRGTEVVPGHPGLPSEQSHCEGLANSGEHRELSQTRRSPHSMPVIFKFIMSINKNINKSTTKLKIEFYYTAFLSEK